MQRDLSWRRQKTHRGPLPRHLGVAAHSARNLLLALVGTLAILTIGAAAASSPQVAVSRFANLPAKVAYIDDTTVVFYHDSTKGDVWRSEDEGKSWKLVQGPPTGSAYMFVEHPYDRRIAFILSQAKKHWRSSDMGKTWHPFETPEPPAVRAGPPLEFNADEKHYDHIIFTGKKCSKWTPWGGSICHDEAYYTTDAFATTPKMLVEFLMHCTWAKSAKEVRVKPEHLKRVYCIAWEDSPTSGHPSRRSHVYDSPDHIFAARSGNDHEKRAPASSPTRLFYSDDYFQSKRLVELDMGRDAKNFVGFGPSKQYLVTALRDLSSGSSGGAATEMALFTSVDGDTWNKAQFPHGAGLVEGAYTIIQGTTHSLVVDVVDTTLGTQTGTLFTSDAEGIHFVKSLQGTSRSIAGIVDYEHLANIEGVSLANVRADVHLGGTEHGTGTKSLITYNDGSSWRFLQPPAGTCKGQDISECSLHLYSVTRPHNIGRVFSSTAPGFVMGVGSVGKALLPYESCDTFLSTDAGHTWKKVSNDAHKYELGDQGSVLVLVNDEESTDTISYSWDFGATWKNHKLGVTVRARILTTIPDGTSQKFLLIGSQTSKQAGAGKDRQVAVFIDFAGMKRKCGDRDFERWDASGKDSNNNQQCMMGHTQFYRRRKANADCFVGEKFHDPVSQEDPCPCTDEDFECDFGFVRDDKHNCIPAGRVRIPSGQCQGGQKTFKGSTGYRKVPANTCDQSKGVSKEGQKDYPCDQGAPNNGEVFHQRHEFPAKIVDHIYFSDSASIVLLLADGSVWRSVTDGLNWSPIELEYDAGYPDAKFLTMAAHPYDKERGYLITSGQRYLLSTDRGKFWMATHVAPRPPNSLGIPVLQFHPEHSDWLIWTGTFGDCTSPSSSDCRAVAYYSLTNGRSWDKIDEYVRTCSWAAASAKFNAPDPKGIICESYKNKKGSQRSFDSSNPLELILGTNYYKSKSRLFDAVEGFAVFDEFMVVAVYTTASDTLTLMISLDAVHFARAQFPPNTRLEKRAYTVLDSNTGSVFMHGTTHSTRGSEWGALFRSNWNGTYFSLTQEHVNRNERGYVDFEKMLGLEGIALANIVSNPDQAAVSGVKEIQTRITHNDAGRWRTLNPPTSDSNGQPYPCSDAGCTLNLHGYTERDDPRATYSSPSAVGLMMAVGNVGRHLAPYKDSDTFLTRDGGFTWEEVHKDAHKWEFGDQGSLLIIVNDEEPTSTVAYTKDEGLTWQEYDFGEKMRVHNILTVPEDTHRKFLLVGSRPTSRDIAMTIHLDFSGLTARKCDRENDFELWSPSDQANEKCLFGREVSYYRRKRDADCYVGQKIVQPHAVVRNCPCTEHDFECEFNHYPDPNDARRCIPYPGAQLLAASEEEQCLHSKDGSGDYWYERTSVRKVPHSQCSGGSRPDRGARHVCSMSTRRHGWFWWLTIVLAPFGLAALVGMWWTRRQQQMRGGYGRIRLPSGVAGGVTNGGSGGYHPLDFTAGGAGDNKVLQTLASVPWFVVGSAGMAWSATLSVAERVPGLRDLLGRFSGRPSGSYGGYRSLRAHDEDAAILREYDDEELER